MNATPEQIVEVVQRLDTISSTLDKLASDQAEAIGTYQESNDKYTDALKTFQESDGRFRRELEAYSIERETREMAVLVGACLRVAAVALLSYIALKVS